METTTEGGPPFDYKDFRVQWDTLLEMKKYRECEKLCHDGLAQSPPDKDRGKLYNHLGYLYENYLEDKTFDDILEHYVLSLQVDETNATSHYNLANFLLEQGMQHLLRALELNDKHTKANKKYAQLSPLRVGSELTLGDTRYRCVEAPVAEDVFRCVKLRKKFDSDEYEVVDEPTVDVRVGTPQIGAMKGHNGAHNDSMNSVTADVKHKNGKVGAMGVEDGRHRNAYVQLNGSDGSSRCCPKPFVLNYWVWFVIILLAIAGVAAPIVGNFYLTECEDIQQYEESTADVNDNSESNILFITDCSSDTGASTFEDQLQSIDTMLDTLTSQGLSSINVGLSQVCDNTSYQTQALSAYDGSMFGMSGLNVTTEIELSISNDIYLTQQLETCQTELNSITSEAGESLPQPLLCVIFVTSGPQDYASAVEVAADMGDAYVIFVTLDTVDASVYPFLGSLSYNQVNVNISWWSLELDCDADETIHDYCQHCLYYNSSSYECNVEKVGELFETGVMETTSTLTELKDYCDMEEYFWYAMGGAAPLLILSLMFMLWLCKNCCCSRNNDTAREDSQLSQHQTQQQPQQSQQKETAYV